MRGEQKVDARKAQPGGCYIMLMRKSSSSKGERGKRERPYGPREKKTMSRNGRAHGRKARRRGKAEPLKGRQRNRPRWTNSTDTEEQTHRQNQNEKQKTITTQINPIQMGNGIERRGAPEKISVSGSIMAYRRGSRPRPLLAKTTLQSDIGSLR